MKDEPREATVKDGSVWPGEQPREGGRMKVRVLKPSVINGSVWPAEAVVEVTERQAQELIKLSRAEAVRESAPKPAPVLPATTAQPSAPTEGEAADPKGKKK